MGHRRRALLCTLFVTLGIWQLDRLGQKRAANARILARMEEPPLVLEGGALILRRPTCAARLCAGLYDFSQEIVLRNRTHNELPGVHVLVPLRIAGSPAAVLVDRGWLPYEVSAREQTCAVSGRGRRGRGARHPAAKRGPQQHPVAGRPAAQRGTAAIGRVASRGYPSYPGTGALSVVVAFPRRGTRGRRPRAAFPARIPTSSSAKARTWVMRCSGSPSHASCWAAICWSTASVHSADNVRSEGINDLTSLTFAGRVGSVASFVRSDSWQPPFASNRTRMEGA